MSNGNSHDTALDHTPETLPAHQHPVTLYIAGLDSDASRRVIKSDLNTIAGILTSGNLDADQLGKGWLRITRPMADALRAELKARYSPATVNRMLSAFRGVIRKAWQAGLIDAEHMARVNDVDNVTVETLPSGRSLAAGEIMALFDVCAADSTPAGVRDAAILAVFNSGPRRTEIAKLELADYDTETGRLNILHGKGNKQRATFLDSGAMEAMSAWLALRGDHPGPLFHPINRGGKIDRAKGMTAQALYNMLKKRGQEAGLSHFSPHDFRRTFVGDMLDAGADIATVQRLVGHANVTTTARYDRRPDDAARKAVNRRRTPYRQPKGGK